jgi:hypothetical protein
MVHNSLSGRGEDDCHSQYLLLTTVFPSVRVYNSADIEIANNSPQILTFDTENWDTQTFHSTTTNTDRLTVPIGYSGTYLIIGHAQFKKHATGQRIYEILHTDETATQVISHNQFTDNTAVNRMASVVSTVFQADDEDYFQFRVYQNSGGALDVRAIASYSPHFLMIRLGPK